MCLPGGRRFRPLVPLGLAGVSLAAEITGVFGQMIPCYTACAPWMESFRRLALLQPPWLGTPTLALALGAEVVVLAMLLLAWFHEARGLTARVAGTTRTRMSAVGAFRVDAPVPAVLRTPTLIDPNSGSASQNLSTHSDLTAEWESKESSLNSLGLN
jgi:hypothetical protein